ncbi:MAM and LDL-receptor class A domain-containing protein 1-like isoform X2 [Acropora muricata]|uniref:MAM and LDL-receptor class A domain-containing protein 1-like isoform X2 n=1 Tax=Acropora muricata TaxID=159855 RepID=UPI0034E5F057
MLSVVLLISCTSLLVIHSNGYRLLDTNEGDCDFDQNTFCSWQQDRQNDNFDWTLRSGRTPSGNTGPQNDHTTGNGRYAYIETSSPRRYGQKARLISGPFSGVQCLEFAYSMVGSTIGKLSVYHLVHGTEMETWSKEGRQRGSYWHTDNITLYGNNYYIIFEATVGRSYTGDIAIDDIHSETGPCKGFQLSLPNDTETKSTGKCNFNLGLCDWATDLTGADKLPWSLSVFQRMSGKKESGISRQDHGKALGGQFAFARQTSRQAKTSRLISSKVCGKKCVEFFYFMENFKNSEFKLSTRKDNKEDRVWFNSGGGIKFEDWTRGLVEINADDGTCQELVFEANLHGDFRALVGMDDVLITNGSCCHISNTPESTVKANCNFDQGTFCTWKSSFKSTFEWSIGRSETPSGRQSGGKTGPVRDASGAGNYAYIESSEPQMLGDKAILKSDLLAGQQCMQFKYHMHGADIGSLSIYRRGLLMWKESGNHGNQWLDAHIDLDCSITEYNVEIEATVVGWRGDIAIDVLTFTPGACAIKTIGNAAAALRPTIRTSAPLPQPPPPRSVCKFEKDLCSWTNALNDDGDWKIHKHETPSLHTGPQYDSDGNDYFIYMEASDLLSGQSVRLESKELFTPICLHFHYHMYGRDIRELKLEQRNLKDNSTKVLWSKKGEQEDYWHSGLQDFYGEHYTVSFAAVRGDSPLGDIALDEISINEVKDCKVLNKTASSGNGVVVSNPQEGNCDFEDNSKHFCKWANIRNDDFDWRRFSKRTPSGNTGPSFDHTKGRNKNGHFIYIETSNPLRRGQKALLLVKLEGKSFCMRFWYHMYGSGIGSLKIMRVIKNTDDDKIPAATDFTSIEWQKQGNQGNRWMMAEQDLLVDRKFKRHFIHWIAIEGTVGNSYMGDIALDDIEFRDGRCSLRRSRKY